MTPRHRRRLGVLVGIALLIPIASGSPATGDPIDDKRAEAARIQDQLEEQGRRVSVATEQFNRAQLALDKVQDSLADAEANVKKSEDRLASVKSRLGQVAVVAYTQGGSSSRLALLARSGAQSDFVNRAQFIKMTANDQRRLAGEYRAAREDYTLQREKLTGEEKEAREATSLANSLRREAIAAENGQRVILGRIQGELAGLVAAEAARRAEEEARRAPPVVSFTPVVPAAAPASVGGGQLASVPANLPIPASSGAATAVAAAQAQIGKPYVYGGSGPDSFDCSGLTQYVWRQAGVSLSHSAYTQYFETTRVPVDQVQPGDLLFFGKNGVESIHHNAIYVGNGQMIEASQTGVPIRYRGWRAGDLVGAGRPG